MNSEPIKLEVKDLLPLMEYLGQIHSSSDTIHTYKKSPAHALAYNEIMRFSKKELESCKETVKFGGGLYETALSNRNPLLFSAFLKKGAFIKKLSKESKWLLNFKPSISDDIYGLIYSIEDYYKRDYSYAMNKKTKWSKILLFLF